MPVRPGNKNELLMLRMKPVITLPMLFAAFALQVSCGSPSAEEAAPGTLSTELVHNPNSLQESSLTESPKMVFDDTLHDFGRMKEGESVQYDFHFTNKGKRDLLITEAKGSCGCTVPSFPKEPVRSQQDGIIQVTFNSAGKKGYNEKSVMVITNATPSVYNLTIRAEVY